MNHYKQNDRLQRLTNFTGSNGAAIVFTERKSVFITDSRYKLQSELEIDSSLFDLMDSEKPVDIADVVSERFVRKDERQEVVIDGSLFSIRAAESIEAKLTSLGIPFRFNSD